MYSITTATRRIAALRKRIKAVQGGTSAGKTIGIEQVIIDRCQSIDGPGEVTSIVSESLPHLKRGAIRDFLSILQQQHYYDDKRWNRSDFTYTFETGAILEFFGADQPDKVRGPRRKRLFINEANNVPFETFEQLEVRTLDEIFLDWNPTVAFWFDEEVEGVRNDYEKIILTYRDNEALAESIVSSIEQRKNRPSWWRVYGQGLLGEVEGKIYRDWKIIEEVPHEARLAAYWVDFGYSEDPVSLGAVYEHNGGYILDEIVYETGMSNKSLAASIKAQEQKSVVIADSAEPKSIDDLKSYGLTVLPAVKGPDSVNFGIKTVQDKRISITKRSVDTIKEYRKYTWLTDKNGKILDEPDPKCDDHSMDGIRYALTFLNPKKGKKSTYVQKAYESPLPYAETPSPAEDLRPMRSPWAQGKPKFQQGDYESSSPFGV